MDMFDLRQPRDAVLFVLLDSEFNTFAMYEASRATVEAALALLGSKARHERGALVCYLTPSWHVVKVMGLSGERLQFVLQSLDIIPIKVRISGLSK